MAATAVASTASTSTSSDDVQLLKRTYLSLLPPAQLVDLCLSFDLHVPLHLKPSLWPPDLQAAIDDLRRPQSDPSSSPPPPPPTSAEPLPPSQSTSTTVAQPSTADPSQVYPHRQDDPPTSGLHDAQRLAESAAPSNDDVLRNLAAMLHAAAGDTGPDEQQPGAPLTPPVPPSGSSATTALQSPQPPSLPVTSQAPAVPSSVSLSVPPHTPPHHTASPHPPYPQNAYATPHHPPPATPFAPPHPPHHHPAQPAYPHTPYYPPDPNHTPYSGYATYPQHYAYGPRASTSSVPPHPPPPAAPPPVVPYTDVVYAPQLPPGRMQMRPEDLPSYEDMICEALVDIADPEGSAPRIIFMWMSSHYPLQANFRPSASQALQKAFKRGRLEKEPNGRYKLCPSWDGGPSAKRATRRPATQAKMMQAARDNPAHRGTFIVPATARENAAQPRQARQRNEPTTSHASDGQSTEDALASILKVISNAALAQHQPQPQQQQPEEEVSPPQPPPPPTRAPATIPASASTSTSNVLSDEDRAALQRHLALLASQFAEIADEEDVGAGAGASGEPPQSVDMPLPAFSESAGPPPANAPLLDAAPPSDGVLPPMHISVDQPASESQVTDPARPPPESDRAPDPVLPVPPDPGPVPLPIIPVDTTAAPDLVPAPSLSAVPAPPMPVMPQDDAGLPMFAFLSSTSDGKDGDGDEGEDDKGGDELVDDDDDDDDMEMVVIP